MNKIFDIPEETKKPKNYDEFYQDKEVFPHTLRKFVQIYYAEHDYANFMEEFKKGHTVGVDGRHELWLAHIRNILNTTMVYPDKFTIKIKHLPMRELLRLIDYFGYEIGMAGYGHGNDTLLGIFKQYFREDWLI